MKCPSGKIVNPATGRCVKKNGKIGMKLSSSSKRKRSSQKRSLNRRRRRSPYASELVEADLKLKSKSRKLSPFEKSELKDMQWLNSL
jgi:hypothetical protein